MYGIFYHLLLTFGVFVLFICCILHQDNLSFCIMIWWQGGEFQSLSQPDLLQYLLIFSWLLWWAQLSLLEAATLTIVSHQPHYCLMSLWSTITEVRWVIAEDAVGCFKRRHGCPRLKLCASLVPCTSCTDGQVCMSMDCTKGRWAVSGVWRVQTNETTMTTLLIVLVSDSVLRLLSSFHHWNLPLGLCYVQSVATASYSR